MNTTHTPTQPATTICGIQLPTAAWLPHNPSPEDARQQAAVAGVLATSPEVADWLGGEYSVVVWLHESGPDAEAVAHRLVRKIGRIIPGSPPPTLVNVGERVLDEELWKQGPARPEPYPEGEGGFDYLDDLD